MKLQPLCPEHPVLVFALPGMGKTHLARMHPDLVYDADKLIYNAVENAFPALGERERLRTWRSLCQSQPWSQTGAEFELWSQTRRSIFEPFSEVMGSSQYKLVVTSLLHPPWYVSCFYGITLGCYLSHLRAGNRMTDNGQSEAMNNRLEGYSPLQRLEPGSWLADNNEIAELLLND